MGRLYHGSSSIQFKVAGCGGLLGPGARRVDDRRLAQAASDVSTDVSQPAEG